jgi:cold shock CspA family protein
MPTGFITQLVHLSQQKFLPNTRLVPDHNDKGYGIIHDAEGQEVYFSHEVVEYQHGFDRLRRSQQVEYTLENAPYLRAASVATLSNTASAIPPAALRPAA